MNNSPTQHQFLAGWTLVLATAALGLTALYGCDSSVEYGQIVATEQEEAAAQRERLRNAPTAGDAVAVLDTGATATEREQTRAEALRENMTPDAPLSGTDEDRGVGAPRDIEALDAGSLSPRADAAMATPLSNNVTVWLAGDSTVSNGNTPCPRGWGGEFEQAFDERVQVVNSAAGGRSVRTWLYEVGDTFDDENECLLTRDSSGQPVLQARWQAMLDSMQLGDFLLIQFGINDGDPSCNRHVGLDAFVESYAMMAQAAKQRGTQPVFITPVSMVRCNGATAVGSRGSFVPATLEAALNYDVPVLDLHSLSVDLYNELAFCPIAGGDVSAETTGPVGDFFCDDHTHFDRPGARRIAQVVVDAISRSGLTLKNYLK